MKKLFQIGLISLAVVAGASAVQASDKDVFQADKIWAELEKTGE